ncbi:MAG: MerR family transcriptional regulator [Coprobacillus sp.]
MKIQEMSEAFDLTQDTLRYYEKIGLLDNIKRDAKGNRDYQEKDVNRLNFIRCMRDAGLSIQVLQKYIELNNQGEETMLERKNLLIQERDLLLKKKALINESLEKLNYKIENYEKVLAHKDM